MPFTASVYIIVPSYNEAEVLSNTIDNLQTTGFEVVVVDDGSTDNTADILTTKDVHYLRHRINLGQGAAIATGIEYARQHNADIFITFDADGQHDVADISKMIGHLQDTQSDVVFGSRFLEGARSNVNLLKRMMLFAGRWINYAFSGILLSDAHNGFRAFNRKAAKHLQLKENRMAHASEFLLLVKRYRLRFTEFPVKVQYTAYSRRKGQSLFNSIRIFFELVLNKLFD